MKLSDFTSLQIGDTINNYIIVGEYARYKVESTNRYEYGVWAQCPKCGNCKLRVKRNINRVCRCDYSRYMRYNDDLSLYSEFSKRSAYFFGFLFADGCIYKRSVSIALHKKDVEILNLFNRWLASDRPVVKYDNYVRWHMTHKTLPALCKVWGVVPNKTYIASDFSFLLQLSHPLQLCWLRGFLDGDGHISSRHSIRFSGHMTTLYSLKNALNTIWPDIRIAMQQDHIYLSVDDSKQLAKWLLEECPHGLSRKTQQLNHIATRLTFTDNQQRRVKHLFETKCHFEKIAQLEGGTVKNIKQVTKATYGTTDFMELSKLDVFNNLAQATNQA